jgi:hypothetical protein
LVGIGVSPVILKVVSIRTLVPLVTNIENYLLLSERAPNSLVLVDVKLVSFLLQMNQLDILFDLALCMGKRAKVPVLTFFDIFGVELAELGLVSVRVVELLKLVMGILAVFRIAFLFGANKMAILDVGRAPLVLVIVVVKTGFSLMLVLEVTNLNTFIVAALGFEGS